MCEKIKQVSSTRDSFSPCFQTPRKIKIKIKHAVGFAFLMNSKAGMDLEGGAGVCTPPPSQDEAFLFVFVTSPVSYAIPYWCTSS